LLVAQPESLNDPELSRKLPPIEDDPLKSLLSRPPQPFPLLSKHATPRPRAWQDPKLEKVSYDQTYVTQGSKRTAEMTNWKGPKSETMSKAQCTNRSAMRFVRRYILKGPEARNSADLTESAAVQIAIRTPLLHGG